MAQHQKMFKIRNKLGLHARPAALFVQTANRFKSEVEVEKEGVKVNGKSIMGIMTLAAGVGCDILVTIDGIDADEALNAIVELFAGNFGEETI
ncbi:MAG: phosphocarrier protein HPr [Omnitrophica bacterium GWA2_52_8]|nr:MAG: phosphocarrier protein HPr [Omnitrophica bacterium GWA2_52_8]